LDQTRTTELLKRSFNAPEHIDLWWKIWVFPTLGIHESGSRRLGVTPFQHRRRAVELRDRKLCLHAELSRNHHQQEIASTMNLPTAPSTGRDAIDPTRHTGFPVHFVQGTTRSALLWPRTLRPGSPSQRIGQHLLGDQLSAWKTTEILRFDVINLVGHEYLNRGHFMTSVKDRDVRDPSALQTVFDRHRVGVGTERTRPFRFALRATSRHHDLGPCAGHAVAQHLGDEPLGGLVEHRLQGTSHVASVRKVPSYLRPIAAAHQQPRGARRATYVVPQLSLFWGDQPPVVASSKGYLEARRFGRGASFGHGFSAARSATERRGNTQVIGVIRFEASRA
jgi:hypothetical protein